MMNCEPPVSRPEDGHAQRARQVLASARLVTLAQYVVAGSARPIAFGTTGLDHESLDHTIELEPIVKALLDKRDKVSHRVRCLVFEQFDRDGATIRFQQYARQIILLSFVVAFFAAQIVNTTVSDGLAFFEFRYACAAAIAVFGIPLHIAKA